MLGHLIGIPAFHSIVADEQDHTDLTMVRKEQKKLTGKDRMKSRDMQSRLLAGEQVDMNQDPQIGIRNVLLMQVSRMRQLFDGWVIQRSHDSVDNEGHSVMGGLLPLENLIVPIVLSQAEQNSVHAHAETLGKSYVFLFILLTYMVV